MNINNFKQHLQQVHGKLDDDPANKQMRDRLQENRPAATAHIKNMHKQMAIDNQTQKQATTLAAQTLKPQAQAQTKEKPIKEPIKDSVEYDEVDPVLEYFENYFGDDLNEDTSNDDIRKAVEDLVDLCEAVCDAVGIDEAFPRHSTTHPDLGTRHGGNIDWSKPAGLLPSQVAALSAKADKSGYLKPSPEQLKQGIAQAADNSPLVVAGQGANQRVVTPSMVRDKAKAKRIKRMKKFGK